MNDSYHELHLALDNVRRDLEYTLACTGDFDLRFGFTNSHGQVTAGDRALAYDIERARAQARALANALADVSSVKDINFDRIRALAMDLGRTLDRAIASAPASNSLERARGLASVIITIAQPTSGCGYVSNRHPFFLANESLEKINRPPVYAENVLRWLAYPGGDDVLGDFWERYQRQFNRIHTKRGVRLAQLDYWWQVLRSVPGFLRVRLRRVAHESA